DLIIGTNVLHAVADVRSTLRNLHDLLAPGGSLVFMEHGTPHVWAEAVFSLTKGWWRFTDRDLRSVHPLLGRLRWETLLRETGFVETTSQASLIGADPENMFTVFARKEWQAPAPAELVESSPEEKSWLIFEDEGGLASKLIDRLRANGVVCRTVRRGSSFDALDDETFRIRAEAPEGWHQLFAKFNGDAEPERIVYLWNLDAEFDEDALFGTDALLHLAQALETKW